MSSLVKLSVGSLDPNAFIERCLDSASDVVLVFDANLQCTYCNPRSEQIFNSPREKRSLKGLKISEMHWFGSLLEVGAQKVLSSGAEFTIEHEIPFGPDRVIFQATYSPVSTPETKKTAAVVIVMRDVTDYKNTEKFLRQENTRLEAQTRALNIFEIVAETDTRGRVTYVNDKFAAAAKYSASELYGKDLRILNSGYHEKAFFKDLWTTISRGDVWSGEICNRAKDRSIFWIRTVIVPTFDDTGKISRFLAVSQDITSQRQMEEAVRESELRFRELVDSIEFVTVGLNLQGQVTFCNRTFLEMSGWSQDELQGADWFQKFVPVEERNEASRFFLQRLTDSSEKTQFEHHVITKKGERRLIVWNSAVFKNLNGDVIGLTSIGKDVTFERLATQRLQEFHERTEKHKEEVVAFVSHELRSPLMSLRAGIELLRSDLAQGEINRQNVESTFSKLVENVNRIERVSRNLLASSLHTSPHRDFKPEPLHINSLLQKLCDQFQMEVSQKRNLHLRYESTETQMVGNWDASRLEQAFSNLLSNAIRYSKPEGGEIVVTLKRVGDSVFVIFKDDGIGIHNEDIKGIFEIFTRGGNLQGSRIAGYGVGLKIAKDFIEEHGGNIRVESEPGVGSIFTVRLPLTNQLTTQQPGG